MPRQNTITILASPGENETFEHMRTEIRTASKAIRMTAFA